MSHADDVVSAASADPADRADAGDAADPPDPGAPPAADRRPVRRRLPATTLDVTNLAVHEGRAPTLGATLVRDDDRRPPAFRVHADPAGHFFRLCTESRGG